MQLESQFFHSFFYPFIIGVILSAAMVIISSIIFTNNYLDKGTANNLVELEKQYAKININTINILISINLLKVQAGLNELIYYYIKIANKIKYNESILTDINEIDEEFFRSLVDLYRNYSILEEKKDQLEFMAMWIIDDEKNLSKIENNSLVRKQLKAFSNMIPNVYSTFTSSNFTSSNIFLIFDETELFIGFPLKYENDTNFINTTMNYKGKNPLWCTNEKGEIYSTYKARCRGFYTNIKRSQTDLFDYNYYSSMNKTIFITDVYKQTGEPTEYIFTMCILFKDPLTDKDAYLCADIGPNEIKMNLENINKKLNGYFFVNSVGFNHAFFFPSSNETSATPSENIFKWDNNYYLNEKTFFNNHIQKIMTSNYIKYINKMNQSIFDEIYSNGYNSEDQYFTLNGEIYNFSIYPITLENLEGYKEHIFNIIYVYNKKLFYNRINSHMNIGVQLLIESIIFVVFGSGLLYLVVLSFNILSKYIVIPIKNVNYMLKGINIGGDNRLEYLDFLKKKQDENVELLEKAYMNEDKKNKKENGEDNPDDNNLIDETQNQKNDAALNNNKNESLNSENNLKDENDTEIDNELINSKIDYNKKFDEENEFIEKESNFYDFDEQLLQFRPLEIDRLVKALINLKGALILTSLDQTVEQIINYSYSENIFRNFKNKEGTTICQSNIGNLQSQLKKYGNSIYHLAISLQDNKLKKFLSKNLSDEFDESDTLLNKIAMSYNKTKNKEKMNLLIEKQLNNTKDNFSQKIIGILINSRYNRLIHFYYKFFSLIQKSNNDFLNGQFMNTNFHNINYYHKILIQYIYLSFVKNDLVKIGESILDYIEFLLKFKFKTNHDNKYIFNIHNKNRPEMKKKQKYKHYIFEKIVNWFNLFDDYISHIRDNTSLGDDKSIIEDFSHSINSSNSDLDSGSQSVFLFRVNVQREEYLKGKLALRCKNLSDALFYFIRAAKKKSIVSDGLIKKKSLKRIHKIVIKLIKKYQYYGIIKWEMKEKVHEYERQKQRSNYKRYNSTYNIKSDIENIPKEKCPATFKQEMEKIKLRVNDDINECNIKQVKDIIIIIDFNKYNQDNNNMINTDKIDSFIDQTKTILENYLSSNDRFGVFIYTNQYQIICPLLDKNKIDINNFSKDLIYYKKNIFNEVEESEDFEGDELNESDLQKEKEKMGFGVNAGSNFSDSENNDSFKSQDKQFKIDFIVKGLIESVNYCKNYIKMKGDAKNEKYIILFTDLFNNYKISDEPIFNNFIKLDEEKKIIFLLAGKNKSKDFQNDKNILIDEINEEKKMIKIIYDKFDEKSEVIYFENMKKIKTILSSNNVIKDDIIYPNEIYK